MRGEPDVVRLVGELDIGSAGALECRLDESIEARRALIVELADCTFVDVRVLRVLREAYDRASREGAQFVVVLPYSAASAVRFMMLRLAAALVPYPVVPDRATALVALARPSREQLAHVTGAGGSSGVARASGRPAGRASAYWPIGTRSSSSSARRCARVAPGCGA